VSGFCGFDASTGALRSICAQPPPTGSAIGYACNDGATCTHGLCIDNLCSGPCAAEADCAANQNCVTRQTTVAGLGTATIDVCVEDPDAPVTPCTTDVDCQNGQQCNDLVQNGSELALICAAPAAGTGQLGDSCDGDSLENRTDCATGLCESDTGGICTVACDADEDCGGGGFICSGSGYSNVPARLCAESCTTNASCDDGRVCSTRADRSVNLLHLVCEASHGAAQTGDDVASSAECATGYSYTQGPDRYCTEFCVEAGDTCPLATPTCTEVTLNKPVTGDQIMFVCARP
jgi:hypothetical protein